MGGNETLNFLVAVLMSVLVFLTNGLSVDEQLLPVSNRTECHGYICDPYNYLSDNDVAKLVNLTESTMQTVRCKSCSCEGGSGLTIGIGIIRTRSYTTTNTTAQAFEDYAYALRILNAWNLSSCGNDVLLLFIKEKMKLVITYGEIAKRNVPSHCSEVVSSSAEKFVSKGNLYDAAVTSIWSIRDVYRNPEDSNLPVCFGKLPYGGLSATVIVLIVLSIVLVFGIVAFAIWHISGQKKLRYLNYNPNSHVRFNNYAGMTDFGSGAEPVPPSTVTGEYAMWQGSVSEGTFDNPGYEERRGPMRVC